jgi:hypothetical protein
MIGGACYQAAGVSRRSNSVQHASEVALHTGRNAAAGFTTCLIRCPTIIKEQYMKNSSATGALLAFALAVTLPGQAFAEDAAPAAGIEQPAMQPMYDMMREMRRDRDPVKCKTNKDAAVDADTPTPMPGMGMMGMGPGKGGDCKMGGGMMRGKDKPCMQGEHKNCRMRGDNDDARLDMLEKRMDMMQMMMEMLLRSGSR